MIGHNIASLPLDVQQEIEREKAAWFKAWTWLSTLNRADIQSRLESMSEDGRADMKRRLNKIIANNKKKR